MADEVTPLSPAQLNIWLAQKLAPEVPFTVAQYVDIAGGLDIGVLIRASDTASRELVTPALSVYDTENGPVQQADFGSPYALEYIDLRGENDPEAAAHAYMDCELRRPVDMAADQLVWSVVLHLTDQRYFWFSRAHHAVMDGLGAIALQTRVGLIYNALLTNTAPPPTRALGPEQIYRFDAEYTGSRKQASDREFWLERMADLPPIRSLAGGEPGPGRLAISVGSTLAPATVEAMKAVAAQYNASDVPVVLAAFALYLARMTDSDDVLASLPVSGRTTRMLRESSGMMSNVVPLRIATPADATLDDLLGEVVVHLTGALRHQRYRVEDLVRELGSRGAVGRVESAGGGRGAFGPTVNIMMFDSEIRLGDALGEYRVLSSGPIDDLMVNIYPAVAGKTTRVDLLGNPDRYTKAELAEHHRRFLALLDTVVAAGPSTPLGAIEVITAQEHERLLAPPVPGVTAHTLAQIFTDAPRVTDRAGAVALAAELIRRGIGTEDRVVIALPRSPASVTAMWAVALTGAAFVPVDPTDPRLPTLVTGAVLGLTDSITAVSRGRVPWLHIDRLNLAPTDEVVPVRPITVDTEAYVIYTSGSTGVPKGVSVTHRGLSTLAETVAHRYAIGPDSRVAHLAAPVFDASLQEILAAAVVGAELVIAPSDLVAGPELGRWLVAESITHLITTPSVLGTLDPADLATIEVFDTGGEACPPELVARLSADTRTMLNAYGPTEATVLATLSEPLMPGEPVTIGSALPGVHAVVLDHRLQPVPDGAIGELYLGGAGVARGYVDAPAATAARFVAHSGGRLYRTGDVVRRRTQRRGGAHSAEPAQPTFEYLGRSDTQVQIHGRRIELGEIEAVLRAYDGVRAAVVDVRDGHLVGYVVPNRAEGAGGRSDEGAGGRSDEVAGVREHARAHLPASMVPTYVMTVPDLPLTAGGKIDRRALPEPGAVAVARYVEPLTHTERLVASVFEEVLGASGVGRDHDFFSLGGDSLSATRVIARLNVDLGCHLGLPALFDGPAVWELARAADLAEPATVLGISDVPMPEHVPLSYGQQRMWMVNQLDTTSPAYNLPLAVRLGPDADPAVLVEALRDVLTRHESLRTYYPLGVDGHPQQVVLDVDEVMPDLRVEVIGEVDLQRVCAAAAATWFDVTRAVPLRAWLYSAGAQMVVVMVTHHINADGWSVRPLIRDLMAAYRSRSVTGSAPTWAPLAVTYQKYSVWNRAVVDATLDAELAYWDGALADYGDSARIPPDGLRPERRSYATGSEPFAVDAQLWSEVTDLARIGGVTGFMMLHTALAIVLARLADNPRVVIGTATAGRGVPELDELVGMFVGTVPLPVTVDLDAPFTSVLGAVRTADVAALAHSSLPFDVLALHRAAHHRAGEHPVFQVVLAVEAPDDAVVDMPFDVTPLDSGATEYDLAIEVVVGERGVSGRILHAVDIVAADTARRIGAMIVAVLTAAAVTPRLPVGSIELETPTALPATPGPLTGTLQNILLARGQAVAVIDPHSSGVGPTEMTYAELDARSTRLAMVLIDRGIGPDDEVALSISRSVEYVVAMWATLKAGAAFMPVDPGYPAERRRIMLETARIGLGSGPETYLEWIDPGAGRALTVAALDPTYRPAVVHPGNLAYVIHTSGTTGRPKPVAITHASVANLAAQVPGRYGVSAQSRVLQGYSVNFDAAVLEMMLAFAAGATLVIAPADLVGGEEMAAFLAEHHITHYLSTPAVLATVPPIPTVRTVAVGGDLLTADTVDTWTAQPRRMLNAYGPTEATVVATLSDPLHAGTLVTIGRPLDGIVTMVLDAHLRPVPRGFVGELYLGGPMLARGYRGMAAETAARFVAAPGGGRAYRTGDRVRRIADGSLVFLDRIDGQVQVRGRRLELGEVETVIGRHPGVQVVAVDVREETVLAWVVPAPENEVGTEELLAHARRYLPGWSVPARIVVVDALPVTAHGKLDRSALVDDTPRPVPIAAPAESLDEELIVSVFAEVLKVRGFGATDSFFDHGGDSLLAIRAASNLSQALGYAVPVRLLFENPTPRRLARVSVSTETAVLAPIVHSDTEMFDSLPASPAERRMWLLSRIDPGSSALNTAFRVELPDAVDLHVLRAAIVDVVDRHRPLRTVYPAGADGPLAVDTPAESAVPTLRPRVVPVAGLDAAVREVVSQPFDLTIDVPLRLSLLDHGTMFDRTSLILVVVVHHIAVDGGSIEPFARDITAAYKARRRGYAPHFRGQLGGVDYGDYRLWQRDVVARGSGERLQFWRSTLAGAPQYLELPTGTPAPDSAIPVDFVVASPTWSALTAFAPAHAVTRFVILHAALAILMAQLGGTEDVVIGTPVTGRTDPALDSLVGMFAGTLALRTPVTPSARWVDFVRAVRTIDLDAVAHQDVPFDDIVDALDPVRTHNSHPIFQVLLAVRDIEPPAIALDGQPVTVTAVESDATQFDLEWTISENGTGRVAFNGNRFGRSVVREMSERFLRILDAVAADPTVALGDIDILTEGERVMHLVPSVPMRTLGEVVAGAVAATPFGVAAIDDDRVLTFADLDTLSNRLAHRLIEHGAGPGRIVAIAVPRSIENYVAVWAVAKVGAGFLPIDPAHPGERIETMLRQSAPVVGLGSIPGSVGSAVLWIGVEPATVDSAHDGRPGSEPPAHGYAPPRASDPAYVIYTSGSTGTPKGVVVTHAGIGNLIAAQQERFAVGAQSRVLGFATPTVDASVFEMLLALGSGAALVPVPAGVYAGDDLARHIGRHRVTHLTLTPSVLQATDPVSVPSAEVVIMAGEASNAALIDTWSRSARVFDAYGPTETTIMATCSGQLVRGDSPHIGRATHGFHALVLDSRLRRLPRGVPGELYLAGPALARGYLGAAALTADRFVANPYAAANPDAAANPYGDQGARMYRTGDIAAWNGGDHDPVLDYLGRADAQITIRGHRIEPAEIETALLQHDGVEQVAVVAVAGTLAAYYVGSAPAEDLRAMAVRTLPVHLIPSSIVAMPALPRTASGKLDTAALPEPPTPTVAHRAPATDTEKLVVEAMALSLGREVGADDDFFDIGGHSLAAVAVIDALREHLARPLPVAWMFIARTPAALASLIDGQATDDPDSVLRVMIPLSPGLGRAPLFCIHPAIGIAWGYAALRSSMPATPLYGVQVPGLLGGERPPSSIDAYARRYVAEIRRIQPHGPYHLLGWSLGGVIAHAVAAEFERSGDTVARVVMLDAYLDPPPGQGRLTYADLGDLLGVPGAENPTDIVERLRGIGSALAAFLTVEHIERAYAPMDAAPRLVAEYVPAVIAADVDFFTAAASSAPEQWHAVVSGSITLHRTPFAHESLGGPAALEVVGQVLEGNPAIRALS